MSQPLRYLYLHGHEQIHLTQSSKEWLVKRYKICFGQVFKLSTVQYKKDIPYLESLFSLLRDEVKGDSLSNPKNKR